MSVSIPHVLTIVLAKSDPKLMDYTLESLAAHSYETLAPGKAVDVVFYTDNPKEDQAEISKLLTALGIKADICLQRVQNRRKKLLICDMDSTLIGQECIDELADFAAVKDRVAAITEKAMRGEIGFEGALIERVGLLKGLAVQTLQDCFDQRISLNAGAHSLAKTMSASGAQTVIVSGGFTFFSQRVAKVAGFDQNRANKLLHDGQTLSGEVARPILGREAKLDALKAFSAPVGGPANAVAIGDGANDLAMITAAGLGIAYRAKPAVARAAHCAIDHADLTSALYFQGFKREEFVINTSR